MKYPTERKRRRLAAERKRRLTEAREHFDAVVTYRWDGR